jgi:uncharacterized protein (DUF302 family)
MSLRTYQYLMLLVFSLLNATSDATESKFMTIQCKSNFTDTMVHLQEVLLERGYNSLRVQKIDVGLQNHGYESDKYRIIFYSKTGEIETLKNNYPVLIPFLPHKITIYSDKNQTVVNALRPKALGELFYAPEILEILSRWDDEMRIIMNEIGYCLGFDTT